jgi:hypothetical protein
MKQTTKTTQQEEPDDTNEPDEKPPQDKPPQDTGDIKEMALDDSRDDIEQEPNTWSEYQPRFTAGGTDQELMPSKLDSDATEARFQMMGLEQPGWGRDGGADNIMYQRNLQEYKIRYDKTFQPPYVKPAFVPVFTNEYMNYFRPYWQPQQQPSPSEMGVPFRKDGYGRDEMDIGQYQRFSNKYQESANTRMFIAENKPSFPDQANRYDSQPFRVSPQFNYLENQRFIGRR